MFICPNHHKRKKEFTFGRIDIRAKLPKGKGIWPALWMLGANISSVSWPACGEIDIMELIGSVPGKVRYCPLEIKCRKSHFSRWGSIG
ncbi:MAG: glycoside hydrolase family 16 protein [Saprospiraceae bacterium]|nr:glycoside hydrolase family 16 protein [Saprospiraceae bacterium]